MIPEFEDVIKIGGFEAVKNSVCDGDDAHNSFPFFKIRVRFAHDYFYTNDKERKVKVNFQKKQGALTVCGKGAMKNIKSRETAKNLKLLKEMMHRHRNIIMENIVIASKNGVIRNDIAPEMIFRMLAGSLRLLIKQYGMSGNAFDLCSESTILFNTWDTLFKVK